MRLRQERLKKAEDGNEECTFQPRINSRPARSLAPSPPEVLLSRLFDVLVHARSEELIMAELRDRDVRGRGWVRVYIYKTLHQIYI